jgi:hypothetical protein
MIKSYIDRIKNINIRNITTYLNTQQNRYQISNSTVRRIIKDELKGTYRTLSTVSNFKNIEKNKIYRKFVVQQLLAIFNSDAILISLDETSFASTHTRQKSWTILGSDINYAPIRGNNYRSITLLMALSVTAVEGFYLIDGSSNQILFSEFLIDVTKKIREKYKCQDRKIVFLLDNLYSHRTTLIKQISRHLNIQLLFNCPYTPETNFIENAFNNIKREVLRKENLKKK